MAIKRYQPTNFQTLLTQHPTLAQLENIVALMQNTPFILEQSPYARPVSGDHFQLTEEQVNQMGITSAQLEKLPDNVHEKETVIDYERGGTHIPVHVFTKSALERIINEMKTSVYSPANGGRNGSRGLK